MKYTARVTLNVCIEANSPEEAHELIFNDVELFSGLEIDGEILVGEPYESAEDEKTKTVPERES
jgi:hypothetical protein